MNIFLILALAAGAVALVYALLLALKIGRADCGHGAYEGDCGFDPPGRKRVSFF